MTKESLFALILEKGDGRKKFIIGEDDDQILAAIKAASTEPKLRIALMEKFNEAKANFIWQSKTDSPESNKPLW